MFIFQYKKYCSCSCSVLLMLTGVFSSFSPDERRFCVFSLTASTDGKEILGGSVSFTMAFILTNSTLLFISGYFFSEL